MYLDANNVYGLAISLRFSSRQFRWLNDQEISSSDIEKLENLANGYILIVDLEYPSHLHDIHNDLTFWPENVTSHECTFCELITSLYDKSEYAIHLNALKQCLDHGLKDKCIHYSII